MTEWVSFLRFVPDCRSETHLCAVKHLDVSKSAVRVSVQPRNTASAQHKPSPLGCQVTLCSLHADWFSITAINLISILQVYKVSGLNIKFWGLGPPNCCCRRAQHCALCVDCCGLCHYVIAVCAGLMLGLWDSCKKDTCLAVGGMAGLGHESTLQF